MSKKKTPVAAPDPDDDDENEQPEPSPAAQLEQQIADDREGVGIAAIEQILDSVDKLDGQFAVKRIDALSGKQLHLERMPISVLRDFGGDPNEFLKTRYGGGQYNLIFYVPQAGGGWRQYTMRRFEIEGTIPPGEFFRAQRASGGPSGPEPNETLLSKLADKIKTEGGGNTELLLGLMQLQAKQSADMLQVMMKSSADTMTAITSMVAALKGGSDKGLDLMNALAVFDKLKGKDSGAAVDPIRLLELAHKWFREHDRDDEDEPTWVKAVGQLLPMLIPGHGGQQTYPALPPGSPGVPTGSAGVPPASASVPHGSAGVSPAVPPPQPAGNGAPDPRPETQDPKSQAPDPRPETAMKRPTLKQWLQQIYPVILAKIKEGVAAEDVYDWLNNPVMSGAFTDEMYGELVELFRLPTWETELFGDAKLVEAHKAWFENMRALFLEPDPQAEAEKKG